MNKEIKEVRSKKMFDIVIKIGALERKGWTLVGRLMIERLNGEKIGYFQLLERDEVKKAVYPFIIGIIKD